MCTNKIQTLPYTSTLKLVVFVRGAFSYLEQVRESVLGGGSTEVGVFIRDTVYITWLRIFVVGWADMMGN